MSVDREPRSLAQLLDRLEEMETDDGEVSFDELLEAVGERSFGPLLLVAGLITLAPLIGDIPGVPTTMGMFVFLIASQLLLQREHVWLPQWLLNRSVSKKRLHQVIGWMRRPARFIDRWVRPRLTLLAEGIGLHVIAAVSIAIALAMPFLEFVPFSANGAGAALTILGLSLTARDGVLVLIALVITAGTFAVVLFSLL